MSARTLTLTILALAFLGSSPAHANNDEDGGVWGAIIANGSWAPVAPSLEKWRWWMEGQARARDDGSEFSQGFVRSALGYQVAPNASLWLGYGWFETSPAARRNFDEHRIFQQLSWSTKLEPFGLASRTRLEQRFIERSDDTGWRFRQFLKLTFPFTELFYLSLIDEVFVALNDTDFGADAGLDQNRFFAGVGVHATPNARFEVGYLNQYLERKGPNDAVNHIFSMTLLLRY